ncbi:MAG: hypothetical protein GWO02_18375 [Gammaproteobacteria bacterium]|nr:hypothetical protein [Gammaproteobacteria bacterium]
MPLRTQASNWFETYVPHHQTVYALEVLAGRGDVELEADPELGAQLDVSRLQPALLELDRLALRCGERWPERELCPTPLPQAPEDTAAQAIEVVRAWCEEIETLDERMRALGEQRAQLELLEELIAGDAQARATLASLAEAGGLLYKRLLACPPGTDITPRVEGLLETVIERPRHRFVIIVAPPDERERIDSALADETCRIVEVPAWLAGDPEAVERRLAERVAALEQEIDALRARIERRRDDHRLVESLGELELLRWYAAQAPQVGAEERLCHVTGWTSEPEPGVLAKALRRAGIEAIVRFALPPGETEAPARAPQTWTGRLFEAYIGMYGTPGRDEVEPSGLLVVIVPLLYGYMFPDVGHGLVLLAVTAALYWRWPAGRFLIPCALSAIVFGFVFGEVFGSEAVVPALWTHPLENPLQVLLAPLLIGVALILLGFALAGLQARWRGELGAWLLADGAVPALYATLLAGIVHREALYLAALALLWYAAGNLWLYRRRPVEGLSVSLARLGKALFQLALNTISFARVGAFALAHAGFSEAVTLAVAAVGHPVPHGVLFVLGHGLLIGLEALVVFVQTTRLVFFEFFLRFLKAEGRGLVPLHPPGGR